MSDYRPTTQEVRTSYGAAVTFPTMSLPERRRAFDRWLEQVKAEARAGVLADSGLLAQPFPTRAEIAEEPTGLPIGFDRWLEQVKAEAWEEGHNAGQHNEHEYRPGRVMSNPYRQETGA